MDSEFARRRAPRNDGLCGVGQPFGLESGGHSERTSSGLPALCTVGAAEFEWPPASGSTALFSIAMEFWVFSPPLPAVALPVVVVQLVSGLLAGAVVCAAAVPPNSIPATIAAARTSIFHLPAAECSDRRGRTSGVRHGSMADSLAVGLAGVPEQVSAAMRVVSIAAGTPQYIEIGRAH